jgi:rare lipoprotein A
MTAPRHALHTGAGAAIAVWALMLAGCSSLTPRPAPRPRPVPPAPPTAPPANIDVVPDAVPRPEARSAHGNPPFYDVFGQRYYVLASANGYLERGVASWYGPNFHGVNTSSGEVYDMYGMTAAHKTLPLPCYARVTNLRNGRSVVVRINDRGPFVANRLIDLSYTAAAKLDMLREGTTLVEVRTLVPGAPDTSTRTAAAVSLPPPPVSTPVPPVSAPAPPVSAPAPLVSAPAPLVSTLPPAVSSVTPALPAPRALTSAAPAVDATPLPPPALYVQAGAFADPQNAQRTLARLQGAGLSGAFILLPADGVTSLYRVRVGPVHSVAEFDALAAQLTTLGFPEARLAND